MFSPLALMKPKWPAYIRWLVCESQPSMKKGRPYQLAKVARRKRATSAHSRVGDSKVRPSQGVLIRKVSP